MPLDWDLCHWLPWFSDLRTGTELPTGFPGVPACRQQIMGVLGPCNCMPLHIHTHILSLPYWFSFSGKPHHTYIPLPFLPCPASSPQGMSGLHLLREESHSLLAFPANTCYLLEAAFLFFSLYSFSLVTPCPPPHTFFHCMLLVREVWVRQAEHGVNRVNHVFALPLLLSLSQSWRSKNLNSTLLLWCVGEASVQSGLCRKMETFDSCGRKEAMEVSYKMHHPDFRRPSCAYAVLVQNRRTLIPVWNFPLRSEPMSSSSSNVMERGSLCCFLWHLTNYGKWSAVKQRTWDFRMELRFQHRLHRSLALWAWVSFITSLCLGCLIRKMEGPWLPASTTRHHCATQWNQHLQKFFVPVEVAHCHFRQLGHIWEPVSSLLI